MAYQAFEVPLEALASLFVLYPPTFDSVVAHHVTWAYAATEQDVLGEVAVGDVVSMTAVGRITGEDIECIVIRLENGSDSKPDGRLLHITWSLNSKSKAVPSDANGLSALPMTDVEYPVHWQAPLKFFKH